MRLIDHYTDQTPPGGIAGVFIRLGLRLFEFVLAIAVTGLYGTDLAAARRAHVYADSKWVYATVVGSISAAVAVVFLLPRINWLRFWPVDLLLAVLWLAVFGVFAKLYVHEDPEDVGHGDGAGPGIRRMKNAVWVDLVNMLLWLATGAYGCVAFVLGRRRTLHTGRAEI